MSFTRTDNGDQTVLTLSGKLDALNAYDLHQAFDEIARERRKQVTLDLAALELIDAEGVAALVYGYKLFRREGGQVTALHANGQPLAIFKLLRMEEIFAADA